jgi:predicted ATPase
MIEVLAQSVGQLVTKDELMSRIWPGAVVMENTLQVHAAAVRKALGPYRNLLKTEYARGYRLLGDWTVTYPDEAQPSAHGQQTRVIGEPQATNNFADPITRLIGRSSALQSLHDLVSAYRIVTLTGPGGIGKTALALEAARQALVDFRDGGWLVELAPLSDPGLVPSAVAGALGLRLGFNTISPEAVAQAIAGKKLLLLLDNCEHMIDAAATLTQTLVRLCPHVTMLVTSREVLRIEGECAYRVPALEVPADEHADPDQNLGHSAPTLFIARAKEQGSDFSSDDRSLRAIATVCRQLDGIPLAIEFAAARAATLGIGQVATALRDRLALPTSGRRTAFPRHRTLRATLDWSYDLLSASERRLLERLAVFSGSFSLEAAIKVTNVDEASEAAVADGVVNLVAKSLVTSDSTKDGGHFRLLETTRAYALSRLIESGELQEVSRRHAQYYWGLLERVEHEWKKRSTFGAYVDNVRAALEWCFGVAEDFTIGVGLAAAAAPMFLTMSLRPECYRWSERAIRALGDATRGGGEEMYLQASLGFSLMHMYGQSDTARVALERSLMIAEARHDVLHQVRVLSTLSIFHSRAGDLRAAHEYARRGGVVAGTAADVAAMAIVNTVLGRSLHFMGDLGGARGSLEAAFQYWSRSPESSEVYLGLDYYIWVGVGLARSLWLQGYPAQATELMCETIRKAESRNQPTSLEFVLYWAPELFLWMGDLQNAEEYADRLCAHCETHFLSHYLAVGRGYKSTLAILRGGASDEVENLKACLEQLDVARYTMQNTPFRLALVQGLMAIRQFDEAITLIGETIDLIEANGDLLYMPEALRVKGSVLLSLPQRRHDDAEACFTQSLDLGRRQGARSWELRTAVDLCALWADQGRRKRALELLKPIFEQFSEGLDTADLKAARRLLTMLS